MAIESCPNCKRLISPSAPACPKCGHPLSETEWEAARRRRKFRRRAIWIGVSAFILFAMVRPFSGPAQVVMTKQGFEGDWPFVGDALTLECERKTFGGVERPVITVVIDGRRYGLNGAAAGIGGHDPVAQVRVRDPRLGTYLDVSAFVKRGLELCHWAR